MSFARSSATDRLVSPYRAAAAGRISDRISPEASARYATPTGLPCRAFARADSTNPVYTGMSRWTVAMFRIDSPSTSVIPAAARVPAKVAWAMASS